MSQEAEGDVLFIELAGLRDPSLVVPTICRYLGVSTLGTEADARDRLLTRLSERPLLLALDTLEHLLPARAALVDLLEACPTVRCSPRAESRCIFLAWPGLGTKAPAHGHSSIAAHGSRKF